jgi:predicted RNA-binding protein (TIGR00451 family)
MNQELNRIRLIADYQFGSGSGRVLFPDNVSIEHSKRTGKIRIICLDGVHIASLRPTDGVFTLSIKGAERLVDGVKTLSNYVTVTDDVAEFISKGKNVFAKHVASVGKRFRPGDEVVVMNSKKRVLAVGRALLNSEEMLSFETGVAVKIRRGRNESN